MGAFFAMNNINQANSLVIHTDGASRNNPGRAAIGVVIADKSGKVVDTISRCIGITTNNQAEYMAVIAGLEKAALLGAREISLRSDSELVIKQLKGQYRVKNQDLKPLHTRVVQLLRGFENFKLNHVPRSANSQADSLANMALDRD